MSDGMGREPAYLSSHATNRYFIPNWGYFVQSQFVISTKNLWYVSSPMMSARAITPFGLLVKTVEKRTETIEGSGGKAPSRGLYGLAS